MSTLNSIDMLTRLVAFPTVSRDSNLSLIDWVEEYLERFSARCRRTWNAEGTKANLFVAIGPDAPGGVVLSGHTDVVPAPFWLLDASSNTWRPLADRDERRPASRAVNRPGRQCRSGRSKAARPLTPCPHSANSCGSTAACLMKTRH